jgi:hypothetical protein
MKDFQNIFLCLFDNIKEAEEGEGNRNEEWKWKRKNRKRSIRPLFSTFIEHTHRQAAYEVQASEKSDRRWLKHVTSACPTKGPGTVNYVPLTRDSRWSIVQTAWPRQSGGRDREGLGRGASGVDIKDENRRDAPS